MALLNLKAHQWAWLNYVDKLASQPAENDQGLCLGLCRLLARVGSAFRHDQLSSGYAPFLTLLQGVPRSLAPGHHGALKQAHPQHQSRKHYPRGIKTTLRY